MFVYLISVVSAYNPFGQISAPIGVDAYGGAFVNFGSFVANIIRVAIVVAGIYAVINFVLAGYGFMSAGGDPKKIADASTKIWQSLIGLVLVAGSFAIGMIISRILFGPGYATAIFAIRVFGP